MKIIKNMRYLGILATGLMGVGLWGSQAVQPPKIIQRTITFQPRQSQPQQQQSARQNLADASDSSPSLASQHSGSPNNNVNIMRLGTPSKHSEQRRPISRGGALESQTDRPKVELMRKKQVPTACNECCQKSCLPRCCQLLDCVRTCKILSVLPFDKNATLTENQRGLLATSSMYIKDKSDLSAGGKDRMVDYKHKFKYYHQEAPCLNQECCSCLNQKCSYANCRPCWRSCVIASAVCCCCSCTCFKGYKTTYEGTGTFIYADSDHQPNKRDQRRATVLLGKADRNVSVVAPRTGDQIQQQQQPQGNAATTTAQQPVLAINSSSSDSSPDSRTLQLPQLPNQTPTLQQQSSQQNQLIVPPITLANSGMSKGGNNRRQRLQSPHGVTTQQPMNLSATVALAASGISRDKLFEPRHRRTVTGQEQQQQQSSTITAVTSNTSPQLTIIPATSSSSPTPLTMTPQLQSGSSAPHLSANFSSTTSQTSMQTPTPLASPAVQQLSARTNMEQIINRHLDNGMRKKIDAAVENYQS